MANSNLWYFRGKVRSWEKQSLSYSELDVWVAGDVIRTQESILSVQGIYTQISDKGVL